MFAAEKTGGVEGFEFFAFAKVEALADIDERGNCGISGAERAGDDGANVRRSDGLRRSVTGVPLILVARMENESEIAGGVRADECGAIHHAGDVFQALSEFNVVHDRVDLWERGENLIGFEAGFESGVTLWIERFGMGHAASHPEDDDGVGGRCDFFVAFRQELPRQTGAQS
jgi:hypothetical protein